MEDFIIILPLNESKVNHAMVVFTKKQKSTPRGAFYCNKILLNRRIFVIAFAKKIHCLAKLVEIYKRSYQNK